MSLLGLFGPDGKRIAEVDSPNGNQRAGTGSSGRSSLRRLPAGDPPAREVRRSRGRYQVKIEELLTADQYANRLAAENSQADDGQELAGEERDSSEGRGGRPGIRGHAAAQERDRRRARLVALGEATHGTREFFQLKHRMLEFLVSELGFTVFGIEATMPEAFDVNEFVLTGKGDPARALAGMYFWTWDTEEVLEMIRWMRNYNSDPRHEKKVKFYGFDAQFQGLRGQGGAGLR